MSVSQLSSIQPQNVVEKHILAEPSFVIELTTEDELDFDDYEDIKAATLSVERGEHISSIAIRKFLNA